MTQVIRIHETGGPEVLRFEDLDLGAPGQDQVRLRILSIGLNRSEAVFRAGAYQNQARFPAPMGYEACGIVEALGPGVRGLNVGERVCVFPNYRLGDYGVYGEAAIVPARSILPAPPTLTDVEAASVWMQYFTAYALIEVAKITIGDYVLIPAASSSVGLAAIQLCNWAGATPIALTRHSTKAQTLRDHGAAHVIATAETDVVTEVMRITAGLGARVAFDPVGGPFVEKLAEALGEDGILFIYGGLSAQPTLHPHWPAAFKNLSIRGWVASYIWKHPERLNRARLHITQGLAEGRLKPVVARVFPLAMMVEAHRYLESNQQVGKVVVTVP